MDRSPRRHGFVWVGVAFGALMLPACSDVSSSPSEMHGRRSSSAVPAAESSALSLRTNSASDASSAVVRATHLFAPPPVPSVDGAAGHDGEPLLRDRTPIVRLAPERDAVTRGSHAPRRLPEVDPSQVLDIERDGNAAGFGTDEAAAADLKHLAAPPDVDVQLEPASRTAGIQNADLRRLPDVDLCEDETELVTTIRRLPSVPVAVAEEESRHDVPEAAPAGDELSGMKVEGVAAASPSADSAQREESSGSQMTEPLPSQPDAAVATSPALDPPVLEALAAEPDTTAESDTTVEPSGTAETPQQLGEFNTDAAAGEDDKRDLPGPWYVSQSEESVAPADPDQAVADPSGDQLRHLPPVETDSYERAEHARQLSPPLFEAERDQQASAGGSAPQGEFIVPSETDLSARSVVNDPPLSGRGSAYPVPGTPNAPAEPESYVSPPAPVAAAPGAWSPVAVPVVPRAPASSVVVPAHDVTFDVITRRVGTLARRAEDLASRNAYFAARAEMIKALRIITQALDAQQGVKTHSDALGRAMRALQEAGDFAPQGSQLESELNLAQIISGHRTTVLKDEHVGRMTPLSAQQRYLEYAQQQFKLAGGDLPAASYALYGLARIYTVMDHAKLETQTLCLPIAVTLHQAALLVNASNVKAANELGVLLARFGQWEDARRVLQHALSIESDPEIWHNMAVVHQRLGEAELARQATQQYELTLARRPMTGQTGGGESVQWVDPRTFSQVTPASSQ